MTLRNHRNWQLGLFLALLIASLICLLSSVTASISAALTLGTVMALYNLLRLQVLFTTMYRQYGEDYRFYTKISGVINADSLIWIVILVMSVNLALEYVAFSFLAIGPRSIAASTLSLLLISEKWLALAILLLIGLVLLVRTVRKIAQRSQVKKLVFYPRKDER